MMRRTATCAGLALALFLSAWLPLDSKPKRVVQPLSFGGIDTVVLQGGANQVHFSDGKSQAAYNPMEIPRLLERRQGRVLVIFPEAGGRDSYDVHLPPSVRVLDVGGASLVVDKDVRMSPLVVRTNNDLSWRGNAPRLDIIDSQVRRREVACDYCGPEITIDEGRIGELRISTGFGRVGLAQPDELGRTILFLGPDARFSLGMAKRQAQVRLLPWRAGIIDAPPQEPGPP